MANERKKIRSSVRTILKKNRKLLMPKSVTVGWPAYDEREIMGAIDALLELRISQGPRVKQFEQECARYVGTKHAVAVNSGSSANLLALTALMQAGKIKKGDEV